MARSKRDHYRQRASALKSERSSFIPQWQELSDFILGYKGRFLVSDRNKAKRNNKILNNSARLASRTLASGMMAGITSPARPWFKLATADADLMEFGPVKEWMHTVETKMREVFNQSNIYNILHSTYLELGVFGTAAAGIFGDAQNVIRAVSYTAGSYSLGTNGRGEVDTFYREYQRTVGQVVSEFGIDNCSMSIQDNWKRGNTESWADLLHVIEPNDSRDTQRVDNKNMPNRSVYMELGIKEDKFLKETGFNDFPIMAPRWDIAGEDIYGTSCPGMDAIGDTKALQLHEKRKSQAIDKLVDPPLQAPLSMKNQVQGGGFMPGDMSFVADMSGGGIKSIYDIRPDINALSADIREDERRVSRAFYEDLFLMLASSDRRQITAREIDERHEEKLLMLGPVLERLHNELLDKLILRTFNIMNDAGLLPPPPEELAEKDLKVEYISVLAQAQRLTAITGIERMAGYAGNLAALWPEARHKFNAEQSIDEYGMAIGLSPHIIRSDEEVDTIVQQEQQAAQQAQMAQSAAPIKDAAMAAKAASETDIESPSALTRAMGLA